MSYTGYQIFELMAYDVHSIHGLGVFLELIFFKRFRPKMFGNFVSPVCLAVQTIFHFAWQHLYFNASSSARYVVA